MTRFEQLPKDIQDKVRNTLRAYDSVNVWFENGRYSFDDVIKSQYAADHKFIGTYKASDIYSEKERIENYINEFHSYPIQYTGKRDYDIIHKMNNERVVEMLDGGKLVVTDWYGKINDNGDFELVEKRTIRGERKRQ